jgi:hypothetical protein
MSFPSNISSGIVTKVSNLNGKFVLIANSFKQSYKLSIEGCSPGVVVSLQVALFCPTEGSIFSFSFPFMAHFNALLVVQHRHVLVYLMSYFLGRKVSSSPLYVQLECCWANILLVFIRKTKKLLNWYILSTLIAE